MTDIIEATAQEATEETSPLLVNRSSLTEEGIKESLTAFLRTPSWITVRVLFAVMAGVGIFILARGLSNGTEMTSVLSGAVLIVFSVFLYLYRFLIYPSKKAKEIIKKRQEKLKTKDIATEYRFFDENIGCLTNGAETSSVTYDSIRKVYLTQHYIVLSTFLRKMLMLTSGGFENAEDEDFYALMREKCPKALPKKLRFPKGA